MADLLRFRKGSFAQINAADAVAGTIYIAKDEKAMYVDISDNKDERIRIGDFIRVNTVEGITPPYSETALYYVEADNALLKYTGAEGGWKQINGTDEIKAQVTNLQTSINETNAKVNAIEGSVTSLINTRIVPIEEDLDESKEGSLAYRVADLEDTVGDVNGGLVKDVNALKDAIGMDDAGNVDGLTGTVLENSQKIAANAEEIEKNTAAISALTKTLTDDYMLASDIEADYVKKTELENDVNTLLNTKGYATTTYVDNAKTDVIATADGKYALLSEYNQLSATVSTLTGDDGAVADAKNAADAAQSTINTYIDQHKGDYANSDIDDLMAEAKQEGTEAKEAASNNAESIASINAKIARIEGSDGQLGLIDTKVNAAKDELEAKITEEINAANAMNYVGGVSSNDELGAIEKVPAGSTYVATRSFSWKNPGETNSVQVYPGDLLIATGIEDEVVIDENDRTIDVITTPSWTVAKTGYDASLEQLLTGTNNAIVLSSPIGSSTSVEFASDGGAMKVEVTGNKASFGVYWEDFE